VASGEDWPYAPQGWYSKSLARAEQAEQALAARQPTLPAPSAAYEEVLPSPGLEEAAVGERALSPVQEEGQEPKDPYTRGKEAVKTALKVATGPAAIAAGPPGLAVWGSVFADEAEDPYKAPEPEAPAVFEGSDSAQEKLSITPVTFRSAVDTTAEGWGWGWGGVTKEGESPGVAAGEEVIDLRATAQQLARDRTRQALEFLKEGGTFTDAEAKRRYMEELPKAEADVNAWYNDAFMTGKTTKKLVKLGASEKLENLGHWVDDLPVAQEDQTYFYSLMSMIPPGEARELIAPFIATWEGAPLQARDPFGRQVYSEAMGLNVPFLSWMGRTSPGTFASVYAGVDGKPDWGGPEMLENIARGEDLYTLFDKIESKADDPEAGYVQSLLGKFLKSSSAAASTVAYPALYMGEALTGFDLTSEESRESAGDFLVATGLTLMDPDIFGVAIGSGAVVLRKAADLNPWGAVREGAAALAQYETDLQGILAKAERGFYEGDGGGARLEQALEDAARAYGQNAGPGARDYMDARVASSLEQDARLSRGVGAAHQQWNKSLSNRAVRAREVFDAVQGERQAVEELANMRYPIRLSKKRKAALDAEVDRLKNLDINSRVVSTSNRLRQEEQALASLTSAQRTAPAGSASATRIGQQIAAREAKAQRLRSSIERLKQAEKQRKANLAQKQRVQQLYRQKQGSRARRVSGFEDKRLAYLAALDERTFAHMMLKDLRAIQQGISLVAKTSTRAPAKAPDPKVVKDLMDDVEQISRSLLDPDLLEDPVALAAKKVEHQKAVAKITPYLRQASMEELQKRIDLMETATRAIDAKLDKAYKEVVATFPGGKEFSRGSLDKLKKARDLTNRAVDGYQKVADKALAQRGIAALLNSVSQTRKIYDNALANGITTVGQRAPAVVKQIQRANYAARAVDVRSVRRAANSARAFLIEFSNPIMKLAGDNPEVQRIFKIESNVVNRAELDIRQGLKEAEAAAERSGDAVVASKSSWLSKYMSDTDGSTLSTSYFVESPWTAAKYYIRTSELRDGLSDAAKGKLQDTSLLANLSRMWLVNLKRGVNPTEQNKLYAAAAKIIKENPDVSWDDFTNAMLDATASILGTGVATIRARAGVRGLVRGAYSAVHAAALQKSIDRMARIGMPDSLKNAENVLEAWSSNEPEKMGALFDDVIEYMSTLGFPAKIQKQAVDASEVLSEGLGVFRAQTGQPTVIPRKWIDKSTDRINRLTNSLERYEYALTDPTAKTAARVVGSLWKVWQMSILSGTLLLDPKYPISIILGNMSQAYVQAGFIEAAQMGARAPLDITDTMLGHIPFVGPELQRKFADGIQGLPSALGATISPTISKVFDVQGTAGDEVVGVINGKEMTYRQLRSLMIEEGVMSSFVGSVSDYDVFARTFGEKSFLTKAAGWGESLASFSQHIEERQRVGMFLNLAMNKKMSPRDAGKLVREALYDWDAPMSVLEEKILRHFFLFWPYHRRALGQYMGALTDTTIGLNNRASRVARIDKIYNGLRDTVDQQIEQDYGYKPGMYSMWAEDGSARMYLGLTPLDYEERLKKSMQGKPVTHVMYSITSPSSMGSAALVNGLYRSLSLALQGEMSKATQESLKLGEDLASPITAAWMRQVRENMGGESNGFYSKKRVIAGRKQEVVEVYKPTELMGLMGLAALPGGVGPDLIQDPLSGKYYMPKSQYTLITAVGMPFFTAGADVIDPILITSRDKRKLGYLFRQVLGIFKETEVIAPGFESTMQRRRKKE
jgi:hypothetical protein